MISMIVPRSRSNVRMTRKYRRPNLSRARWYKKSGYSPRHSRSSASGRWLSSWKSSRSKPGGGEARESLAHPAPEPAPPSAVIRPPAGHQPARPHNHSPHFTVFHNQLKICPSTTRLSVQLIQHHFTH
ncbi:unnamed protein product [Pieris brassicae]|uniref:Uncharacterized protein n=1 Tax=Pieris brassicae TaxID=7116 RepID=A0A9P0XEQ6_PIEBR|nr:unnamed protein product [Pieris brassicae]